jgi:hypothetical protein
VEKKTGMNRRNLLRLAFSGATITSALVPTYLASSTRPSKGERVAKIEVDWTGVIARTTPLTFGSNDYEVLNPRKASDLTYQQRLSDLGVKLIRIHHADLSDRWSNALEKTWDAAKIRASYEAASYLDGATIIQNIPKWPKWMKQEKGLLDPSEHDRYAAFCAELVEIVNRRYQYDVIFWEPINERDVIYSKAGKLDELWQIYNQAAIAMKKVDPKIKVGGPVLTWDNTTLLESFLKSCHHHTDLISWHRYGSGDAKASNETLMAYTPQYASQVKKIRTLTSKFITDRKVPLLLGEYNINFSWKSGEQRQNTQIGAVWFASVLKHLAEANIDMAASWHLKDGIYGLVDPKNNFRPAATVFQWGIRYLVGDVVRVASNQSFVEAMAIKQDSGKSSVFLINKSHENVRLMLESAPAQDFSKKLSMFYLNGTGLDQITKPQKLLRGNQILLKPYALALLHFQMN